MDYGLYVHIPFCRQKCFYCDFPSYAGREELMEQYIDAMLFELERRTEGLPPPGTVYIGGGTPTVLPPFLLARVLEALGRKLPLGGTVEFSLEANPGTVSGETFSLAAACGVNRVSLGVQSFDDGRLKKIGRIHTVADAALAVELVRRAGIKNLNLDLIYALPDETLTDLQHDLKAAVALGPEHISIYGLQVEEGTVFGRLQEEGRLSLPDEDTAEAMYDWLTAELPRQGYERYEISNFARRGFESRHNLGYWQDRPYIGIGAAAHSFWGNCRQENPADLKEYIGTIGRGELPLRETERPTRANLMSEFCFLALRTAEGIDKASFERKFGVPVAEIYAAAIERLRGWGLLRETAERISLTPQGMKLGNVAFAEFLLDEDAEC